ncbi:PREDICTED: uncharacterized protein LOC104814182 isoform X1 [Tarenaya hassleriana]|uniref:uncharacterized protein LOC104814182 isoform X1 n=1 Tax=Tarenaya hassleriana TaxID=28532 RepID=UPI00053C1F5A|nr:PREDICTED: uncharacterized protein LOC104814182 isoform X1 [Tarenaya hassleriana]
MGLTNFILTVAGVSAVVVLLRSDVKQSAAIFRRNVKHLRNWLEEESSAASNSRSLLFSVLFRSEFVLFFRGSFIFFCSRHPLILEFGCSNVNHDSASSAIPRAAEATKPKEIDSKIPEKGVPKEKD